MGASDAIQAELEAQGIEPKAARPDPKKAGATPWGSFGGAFGSAPGSAMAMAHAARPTYDPKTEARLDQWVQAKRARDFTVADAIQAELEARGIEPKLARPDQKKAGANPFDAGGGACYGGPMMAMAMMNNMTNMMSMMKGKGGKAFGKGRQGPY